jgi:hypothetical protein
VLLTHGIVMYPPAVCLSTCCHAGYLPSFWIKLRNLDIAGPVLQLPGVSSQVSSMLLDNAAVQL